MPQLTQEEMIRYSRHLTLPEVGKNGQEKLKAAKILLVGAGGLGSPNAMYLAAAGIGTLGIVDFDVVDPSNLQRQLLFETKNIGKAKVEAAQKRILGINPHVRVKLHNEKLTSANALKIIKEYDVVIDGTDNFPTRYLVNDACVLLNKPNVYGSAQGFEGQASFFKPKEGPCYRCLYPDPPPPGQVPTCADNGVLGILPGLVGLIQASEAIKFIVGAGENLVGRFVLINVLKMIFREIKISRDPDCPVCGEKPSITELIDYEMFCGQRGYSSTPSEITPTELKTLIDSGKSPLIIDVREPFEHEISQMKGSRLIPLGKLQKSVQQLDKDKPYVVFCRTGNRSGRAAKLLRDWGFKSVKNLKGGLNGYSEVDPSIPKY